MKLAWRGGRLRRSHFLLIAVRWGTSSVYTRNLAPERVESCRSAANTRGPLSRRRNIPLTTHGRHMKRVTGIGGIFFKAKDAPSLQAWYKRHLGIDVQVWGGAAFTWTDAEGKPVAGTTAWSISPQESDQFAPSSAPFMVNYRVEDVHALVKVLKEEGCNVLEQIDESEYGKFGWVIDPEGNKVELWQPPQGQ
jgi:predicted enzyme related to lactoylglutathione lyase